MAGFLYYWKLYNYCLTVPLSILGFSEWSISLGVWVRFTKDPKKPRGGKGKKKITTPSPLLHRYAALRRETSIRLLELREGVYGDPLVGSLIEVDLNSVIGEYTALSYAWRDPQDDEMDQNWNAGSISFEDGSTCEITKNLDRALRALRSHTHTKMIWIDAVCINQADLTERAVQVRLMGKIYENSFRVLSWLGRHSEHSALGFEILSYLKTQKSFERNPPWLTKPAHDVANGIRDILQRTYFGRLWIVQEAARGPQVRIQAGDKWIEWNTKDDAKRFLANIKLLEISPAWRAETVLSNIDFRSLREILEQSVFKNSPFRGNIEVTLLDLAHAMRFRYSTDPRDMIYGVMGLAPLEDIAAFIPDYSLSFSETHQKFQDYVYHTVLKEHNI